MAIIGFKFLPVILIGIGIFYYFKSPPEIIPKLPETWWGPGKENLNADRTVRAFEIKFSEQVT